MKPLVRPSVGSWVTYGLEVKTKVTASLSCVQRLPDSGISNWRSGFLPGVFQGTYVDSRHREVEKLIEHIQNKKLTSSRQRRQLDLLQRINREHVEQRQADPQLEARIHSFELAYRMQMDATDAFDIQREPEHIRDMYGDGVQGRQMLIARRLLERGVRFVQLWHGAGQPWDNHDDIEKNHRRLARECDQPIGALLTDLKQRGMLEDTLVLGRRIWADSDGGTSQARCQCW